jgi:GNAT superfamily N-acetyltransferase
MGREKLVGAVRVLSDTIFRSIIYDLLVEPAYQGKGNGKKLVEMCITNYPDSDKRKPLTFKTHNKNNAEDLYNFILLIKAL